MFKYKSYENVNVNQTYCLLCTSIIASNNGFDADLNKTELVGRNDLISMFYQAYYQLIAGVLSEELNTTVDGMDIEKYVSEHYNIAKEKFEAKEGADSFNRLNEYEKFLFVFQSQLIPVTCNAVAIKLKKIGIDDSEIKERAKQFRNDFVMKLYCVMERLMILCVNERKMWEQLYDFAMDMPHVVIGLRKQISRYDSMFFRENKNRLGSLIPYMRNVHIKFSNYTGRLSIAGVIINTFMQYQIHKYMGEFAGVISSGSGVYVDDEGVMLWGSELQEKMGSGTSITDIDRFSEYIAAIDKGSALYDIGTEYSGKRARYFNLIEWLHNKQRASIISSLKGSNIEALLLTLGYKIGGYLTTSDIASTMGEFTPDKKIRFDTMNNMIQEAYDLNVDSEVARGLIDKWYQEGLDAKERGDAKNGRYPMNFKYKGQNSVIYNKQHFKDLIQGVTALKALETAVKQMDSTFLSFPAYGYDGRQYELITGVNLRDYLNQTKAVDVSIEIESDIDGDVDMSEAMVIDNISSKASEITKVIVREHNIEKIQLGSLTDDELAITVDKESDRELLTLLKTNGINLVIDDDTKSHTVHDVVFDNIRRSLTEAESFNQIGITSLIELTRNLINGTVKDTTRYYLGTLRFGSKIIALIAQYAEMTHSYTSDSEDEQKNFVIDNEKGMFFDIAESIEYESSYTSTNLMRIFGREFSQSEVAELKAELYHRAFLGYKMMCSKLWNQNRMCNKSGNLVVPFIFNNFKKGTPNTYWDFVKMFVPKAMNPKLSCIEFVYEICRYFVGQADKVMDIDINADEPYFFARSICFGINVSVAIESILAALGGIAFNVNMAEFGDVNTNSEDLINVRLLLKSLNSLDKIYSPNNSSDKFGRLKTYEDVYDTFFDAVNFDYNIFKKKSAPNKSYYRFVFMDSIQHLDSSMNDIDERLLQYTEVTKVVHLLLTNIQMYKITIGGKNYAIKDFINLVQKIYDVDKANADKEYFVDSVAMSVIEPKKQKIISGKIQIIIDKDNDDYYESSPTWLENLAYYCNQNEISFGSSIKNRIRVNYERYKINEYGLIELNNKVIHTIMHEERGDKTIVLSRYGIFGFDGSTVTKVRRLGDLRWLLR